MIRTPAVAQVVIAAVCFLPMIAAMIILSKVVRRCWGEDKAIITTCASTVLILGSLLAYAITFRS